MKIIIEGYSKSIHKKDNQIIIKEENKELENILAEKISDITIIGKGYITFDALELLSKNNVKLIKINYTGQIEYILNSPHDSNITLRRKQYTLPEEKCIKISQEIIKNKILNQKYTLKTLNKNKKDEKINKIIQKLEENITRIQQPQTRNTLLGIEGHTSNLYWEGIQKIMPPEIKFKKRNKKPAQDLLNAMLNYGYAILATEITKNIILTGLDPYCGILHTDLKNRTSLTYDLIEEYRQQLVDKVIISMINKKQITIQDYDKENNMITLEKRKIIINNILNKLNSQIKYQENKTTYKQIIEKQIKKYEECILKDKEYKGFFLHW